jgi:hypothetical protein
MQNAEERELLCHVPCCEGILKYLFISLQIINNTEIVFIYKKQNFI